MAVFPFWLKKEGGNIIVVDMEIRCGIIEKQLMFTIRL